jgi:primosomal protein N' (replication factor Y)
VFAPVHQLGLVAVWDDGDDLHAEPRSPYPHVREVLALRSTRESAALLVAGHAVTAESARWLGLGWALPIRADRARIRAFTPRVATAGEDTAADPMAHAARLPQAAWRAARDALRAGPVLVQVPRAGYVTGLACAQCRAVARCGVCTGPLRASSGHAVPECAWCAATVGRWQCRECGRTRWRALSIGSSRTAEELGRAFPGVPVRASAGDHVLAAVPATPALVVATPGAEPVADGGYAAALLLDADALVNRPDLRAGEEALRRWLNAAALVRPAPDGGAVVIVADAGWRPVQALLRWDALGAAERELADRVAAGLPPAVRAATITAADPTPVLEALPPSARVLGPAPVADRPNLRRAVVTVPWADSVALAEALHAAQAVASARKDPPLTVVLDPVTLG